MKIPSAVISEQHNNKSAGIGSGLEPRYTTSVVFSIEQSSLDL
jgi:hypothetical protein